MELGPMSAVVAAAKRIAPKANQAAEVGLPFHEVETVAKPRVIIVGKSRNPPATTRSLVSEFERRGLVPGRDIIFTRYRDIRVAKPDKTGKRAFARFAPNTGADGLVIAGQGQKTLILPRGGGNLRQAELRKLAMLEQVDGVHMLTDKSFIERAGSKAITKDVLEKVDGVPMPLTFEVKTADEAGAAAVKLLEQSPEGTTVLKKVNSLGGKDVHFVKSEAEARAVLNAEPGETFVAQEYLPNARNQDIRGHAVYNSDTKEFEPQNFYVRNRNVAEATPNLANNGYATLYVPSPWEVSVMKKSVKALAEGSKTPPTHVALDFFPRNPITAATSERNAELWRKVSTKEISLEEAVKASKETMVIGEASSSAGTKGTEAVLGGKNPVVSSIVDETLRRRNAISG